MSEKTTQQVEHEIKNLLMSLGAEGSQLYMSVKACESKVGYGYSARFVPTGMFHIDLWGIRNQYHKRSHVFRTTKKGEIPVARITEFVTQQLAARAAETARKAAAEVASRNTESVHAAVIAHAKDVLPQLGEYRITNNSGIEGKVVLDLGKVTVDEEQAKAILSILGRK